VFSQAEVQPSRGRLIVDCKDAPDSASDLRDPSCLAAVLGHLERAFGIESVVLSHYVERQYGRATMDVLRRILAVVSLLDQLGTRPPAPNFPSLSRKEIASKCRACPYLPKTFFGGLRSRAVRGFAEFHATLSASTEKLHAYREPGCNACVEATTSDLIYLFRSVSAIGEDALIQDVREEGSG